MLNSQSALDTAPRKAPQSGAPMLATNAMDVWRKFRSFEPRLADGRWIYPRARIAGRSLEYLFVPSDAPPYRERLAISLSPITTRWATDAEDDALFEAIKVGQAEVYLRANRIDERWFEEQTPRIVVHAASGESIPERDESRP